MRTNKNQNSMKTNKIKAEEIIILLMMLIALTLIIKATI